MVLHQSGAEQHAVRIDDAVGRRAEDTLKRRITENKPSAGTEAAVRHQIDGLIRERPSRTTTRWCRPWPTERARCCPDLHAIVAKWDGKTLGSILFSEEH